MKIRLAAGLVVNAMVLVAIMPWTGTAIGTPGSVCGSVNAEDPYWLSNWSGVMHQFDSYEQNWVTGITLYEGFYSSGQGDQNGFNRYIAEMTIPWIGIQMVNENMTRYNYSEETAEYHLYLDPENPNIIVHNYTQEKPWYSVEITYILDADGDSNIDWEILEYIELSSPGQNPARIRLEYTIGQVHPNWNTVQEIEIPFLIDADVYDTPTNNFYWGTINPPNPPTRVTSETWVNAGGRYARVARTDPGNERAIDVFSNPAVNPTNLRFYFLTQNGAGEYSQHPSSYLDNENLQDMNGLVWYVELFRPAQNNPPPIFGQGQWNGVFCEGFQA